MFIFTVDNLRNEKMTARVENYKLRLNGRHTRIATKVTFENGKVVRFTERMSKRQALKQANELVGA